MNFAQPGRPAPPFSLSTVEGHPLALADLLQARQPILLVFLRHLG